MNTLKKYRIFLVILLLIASSAFWYLTNDNGEEAAKDGERNYPFTNPDLQLRYTDDELGFFVDYPEGFTVNEMEEENVKVLVFSKIDSDLPAGEVGESFQIFAMPFDESGPITPERIFIDQPDMVMKDPQTVQIAGEEALVFFGTDPDIGDVREVWFVHPSTTLGASGHLYQASTYAKYDELLAKVMKTFKFK